MSNPVLAINMSKVVNRPESINTMKQIGPKVCITTATNPGFLGFEQLLQSGIHPMAGRYGGGAMEMTETLNPLAMYQYTFWKDVKSHEEMHFEQFNTIYELCGHCLDMVVEGPWEPYYEIIASDIPLLAGMTDVPARIKESLASEEKSSKLAWVSGRSVMIGEHWIMDGRENDFEEGALKTLSWLLKKAPGMTGWMILRQTGVSAVGSFQLDPEGMTKATLGANPPEYNTNFGNKPPDRPPVPAQIPVQYLVHTEWESADTAHQGLGKTLTNYELKKIHNEGVLQHLVRGPYYIHFQSMMEEGSWREKLVK